ncbi:protein arginine kinase [Ruminococcus sp. YE282]|uniref:protein arginine kinase n=1 Tax=Ruminococcus sp. YE282 TaxID=3158780 RepID=UPI0008918D90|nr:protein arginine kinase [Ruminococcus bromii]SCY07434.1 protein arginine kinase [Ruminococcus bromii]
MSNDVVISTRVRLARNLKDYPFPCRLSTQDKEKIIEKVKSAIENSNSPISKDFSFIRMSELTPQQGVSLVERRLVSPEFISESQGRALLLSKDESISIMINEEDHIRLQVINNGLSLEDTYDIADKLDTLLDENLDFAFDDKLGYLTQCPTNLGTGMRASVMLHLPALEKSRAIGRIAGNLSKLGLTIRGAHGEGTEPNGALYQLSNQVTLGISEKAAIENLKNITMQLISQENQARTRLCSSIDIQDAISRSLGILKSALVISHDEALKLLSNVRLGIVSGQIKNVSTETVDKLMLSVEPATLSVNLNKNLSPHERDIERAKLIQSALA